MSELRDLYDQQLRQNVRPDASGSLVDASTTFVRWFANESGLGWSEVLWTSLDENTADAAIADHVDFYASRNLSFLWTVYDYDRPDDLGVRLERAGFTEDSSSAIVVASCDSLTGEVELPAGVTLVHVEDDAGIDELIAVHESVFGHRLDDMRKNLQHRLRTGPHEMDMFVVHDVRGTPISSSRVEYFAGTEFAALWGGSTEAAWRGQGLYRAQVLHRARMAKDKGFAYLMVMASENSRPILEKMGFALISRAVRYKKVPSAVQ
ncbi:MAG TPA: hypothetical protein VGG21_06270 [Acidimicrobiales bacterium]|jgi:GNAT superfamily N-acetyltransferase